MSINIFWLSFLIVHWGFISFQLDYPLEGTLYPYTLKPYHHNAFSPFQIFHLCFSTIILFIWCYIPLTGSSILAAFVTVFPPSLFRAFPFFFSLSYSPSCHKDSLHQLPIQPNVGIHHIIQEQLNMATEMECNMQLLCNFSQLKKKILKWNEMKW